MSTDRIHYLLACILAVSVLLSGCAEPDKPTIGLYVAIKRADIDQVERHIYWKSAIDRINIDGQAPLHESAIAGHIVIARLLLQNGADINQLNEAGQTPLDLALLHGRTQLAEIFIDRFNADFDATAALFDIVNNDIHDQDVINLLARRGAQTESFDDAGNTPLIIAIQRGKRLVAKHLIDNKADVNFPAKDGRLPLDIAQANNNTDLISLLKRNGAWASTPRQ